MQSYLINIYDKQMVLLVVGGMRDDCGRQGIKAYHISDVSLAFNNV